jgi:hypothetical protein
VRRHGGQAQSGAHADAMGGHYPRGAPPQQGALPACLRGRSPYRPVAPPASLASWARHHGLQSAREKGDQHRRPDWIKERCQGRTVDGL